MARLASSLRRAASLDSVTLGGLRSQRSQSGDGEVQVLPSLWTRWSTPTFSRYSERPVSRKFKAKTVSFNSLMFALSREDSPQPTCQTAAPHPRPPDSMRPTATPPEGPSVAAKRDVTLLVAGRSLHRPSFLSHGLDCGTCQRHHVQHHPSPELGLCFQRQHRRRQHHQHSSRPWKRRFAHSVSLQSLI